MVKYFNWYHFTDYRAALSITRPMNISMLLSCFPKDFGKDVEAHQTLMNDALILAKQVNINTSFNLILRVMRTHEFSPEKYLCFP